MSTRATRMSRPFDAQRYLATWRQLEQAVELGLVRHIGTSNMTIPKLELLLQDARIAPAANQLELHPHFQQPELVAYLEAHDIAPIAFSPIGSPARPARDRTPEDSVDVEDPVIVGIARRLGVHPAVVCLKWAIAARHDPRCRSRPIVPISWRTSARRRASPSPRRICARSPRSTGAAG